MKAFSSHRTALLVFCLLLTGWVATAARNPARRPVVSMDVVAEDTLLFDSAVHTASVFLPAAKALVHSKQGRLFRLSLDSPEQTERPLFTADELPDPLNIAWLTASADGKRIAFVASPGNTHHYPVDLYASDSDGGGLVKLTEARSSDASGAPCLRISEGEDGVPGGRGSPYCSYPYQPVISPDGSRVAYKASEVQWLPGEDEPRESCPLRVAVLDGGEGSLLAENVDSKLPVFWSPDGRRLYYGIRPLREDGSEGLGIFLMRREVAGSDPQKLATLIACEPLGVAPDESKAYCRHSVGVRAIDLESGLQRPLSALRLEEGALSPDGRFILGRSQGVLHLIETSDGQSAPLRMAPGVRDTIGLTQLALNFQTSESGGPPTNPERPLSSSDISYVRRLAWIDDHTIAVWVGDASRLEIVTLGLGD